MAQPFNNQPSGTGLPFAAGWLIQPAMRAAIPLSRYTAPVRRPKTMTREHDYLMTCHVPVKFKLHSPGRKIPGNMVADSITIEFEGEDGCHSARPNTPAPCARLPLSIHAPRQAARPCWQP